MGSGPVVDAVDAGLYGTCHQEEQGKKVDSRIALVLSSLGLANEDSRYIPRPDVSIVYDGIYDTHSFDKGTLDYTAISSSTIPTHLLLPLCT